MDKTIRVDRHDYSRDKTEDLTKRLGINQPGGSPSTKLLAAHDIPVGAAEGSLPAEPPTLKALTVDWSTLSRKVLHEEKSKSTKWGDHTVEYWTYWYVHYQIRVPYDIRGG